VTSSRGLCGYRHYISRTHTMHWSTWFCLQQGVSRIIDILWMSRSVPCKKPLYKAYAFQETTWIWLWGWCSTVLCACDIWLVLPIRSMQARINHINFKFCREGSTWSQIMACKVSRTHTCQSIAQLNVYRSHGKLHQSNLILPSSGSGVNYKAPILWWTGCADVVTSFQLSFRPHSLVEFGLSW